METPTVKKRKLSKKDLADIDAGVIETPVVEEVVEVKEPEFDIVASFDPSHIAVLENAIRVNTPTLLVGHTGLGKTTLVRELANRHGVTLIRLSVHSGITADEILGKWLADAGSTLWQDGLLVQAMKSPKTWIVFDEINACPADVLFALHSLLDDDRHVTLLEKRGEIVRPHADFRFFATMNPQDDYTGTKDMNMAFMSRFNAVIEIEPYMPEVEVKILMSKGLKQDTAEKLVSTANKLRDMKKVDDIMYFCGTRDIISTGLMIDGGVDISVAFQYGIFNKMSNDDRTFVKGKVPDFNFKTKEQLEIEKLTEQVKSMEVREKALTTTIGKLEQQVKQGNGNANLDAKTLKALKILKVLN